ncbi:MAG: RNA polymerase sigma factor, partial [bacterium]|nr:RNA polymerase sigma factor [bacterium]
QNKEKIFNLAYRSTGNTQDAEDLLQEIFSKAFIAVRKNQYQAREDAAFSTWLYRIGINCCISFLRKNKKHFLHLQQKRNETDDGTDPPDILDTARSNDPGPEHSARMKQVREKVNKALSLLSAKQRMIFVLRFYQGLQVNEIARQMGSSEGSVKKQLSRATAKIRENIGGTP